MPQGSDDTVAAQQVAQAGRELRAAVEPGVRWAAVAVGVEVQVDAVAVTPRGVGDGVEGAVADSRRGRRAR